MCAQMIDWIDLHRFLNSDIWRLDSVLELAKRYSDLCKD